MTKQASRRRSANSSDQPARQEPVQGHTSLWSRPGFLIRRLHQIHVAIFLEELSEDNITPIQYGLLSILADSPNLDQLSLAEELGIDRANVADVLGRLENRGLVKRVASMEDKRRKLCSVTPEGLMFVRKYYGNMQRAQERLLYPLTPAEREDFMRLVRKIADANNDLGRAPLRPPLPLGKAAVRPPKRRSSRTA